MAIWTILLAPILMNGQILEDEESFIAINGLNQLYSLNPNNVMYTFDSYYSFIDTISAEDQIYSDTVFTYIRRDIDKMRNYYTLFQNYFMYSGLKSYDYYISYANQEKSYRLEFDSLLSLYKNIVIHSGIDDSVVIEFHRTGELINRINITYTSLFYWRFRYNTLVNFEEVPPEFEVETTSLIFSYPHKSDSVLYVTISDEIIDSIKFSTHDIGSNGFKSEINQESMCYKLLENFLSGSSNSPIQKNLIFGDSINLIQDTIQYYFNSGNSTKSQVGSIPRKLNSTYFSLNQFSDTVQTVYDYKINETDKIFRFWKEGNMQTERPNISLTYW